MTQYIQQLNSVYEKMITAMTINMYRPMGGAPVEMPENRKTTPNKNNTWHRITTDLHPGRR